LIRAFSIDPRQELAPEDEDRLVRLGAGLGYASAWTPATPGPEAFDRCVRWHGVSGLPTGINIVPASGVEPKELARRALRTQEATGGTFTLGVGSGQMEHPAAGMRIYLARLRELLPDGPPIMVAALGPLMLKVAAELGDSVAPNWCSAAEVTRVREVVDAAARAAGRAVPPIVEYIRTAVDPDRELARHVLGMAALQYALHAPPYRRHFERMGFADELRRIDAEGGEPSDEFLAAAGAAGRPGEVRAQFDSLAVGLDLPIVRVLVTRPGDAQSAELVLRECAPAG
jgi:alkanesulfonate monooxygenase SsuD/methylene tetrahydromethanopterin reductase-like flavin-dependent oxidoreductase (luciferase family)